MWNKNAPKGTLLVEGEVEQRLPLALTKHEHRLIIAFCSHLSDEESAMLLTILQLLT